MDNPQVLIICLDCNHNGTNIGNDMQCKNCLSYNTRRFIETEPVMDEVAWHNFGYVWAKWRGINWYSAMGDIEDHRKEFGDADTLQACVEGMARAHLTMRPADGATPEGFCECGISIESHSGVYCSFRPAGQPACDIIS